MSKQNRNKKSPMFVSNMVTNYDFVDYTEPGQPAPSSFGNPNLAPPSSYANQQASPKKNQQNWFDQMVNQHSSPNQGKQNSSSSLLSPNVQSSISPFESNQNYTFSNGPSILNISVNQKYEAIPPLTKTQTTPFGTKNQYSQGFVSQETYSTTSFQTNPKPQQFSNNFQSGQKAEQKKYQFKTTNINNNPPTKNTTQSNAPSSFSSNNYSNNFSTSVSSQESRQPPKTNYPSYEAPKQQKQQFSYNFSKRQQKQQIFSYDQPLPKKSQLTSTTKYNSSSSSSGTGFTDQSIVDGLPQPARSNILAMIRRNKGQNI